VTPKSWLEFQKMKLLMSVFIGMLFLTRACFAQTGTVTFYSAGFPVKDVLKTVVVPVGTEPFGGWLFDGQKRLAHARGSRFITFHLTPGPHSFSATYRSSKPGSATALIDIQADHHYCVRLSTKYVNYYIAGLGSVAGKIEQVPCQQAFQEAGTTKPLEAKRVEPTAQPEWDTSASFPKAD
jgi:hypothetical protein